MIVKIGIFQPYKKKFFFLFKGFKKLSHDLRGKGFGGWKVARGSGDGVITINKVHYNATFGKRVKTLLFSKLPHDG